MAPSRILIADADTLTRQVVRLILEEHGYRVGEATTGREAVAAAPAYDLIIVDVGLPDLGGPTAAREIRVKGMGRRTPIVGLFTGDVRDEDRSLEAGMEGVLLKPLTGHELVALVRRCLSAGPEPSGQSQSR